jgi:two-component system osmolarity sensor histidine kinase EnvZ
MDLQALLASRVQRFASDRRGTITLAPCLPANVMGDSQRLTRLIDNLLENALRYGAADGQVAKVDASVIVQEKTVTLGIKDHGNGVDAKTIETLTQPFVRGDEARSGADGSGLGLAIVAKIAQQHGAKLTIVSELGKGFEVSVRF